MQAWIFNSTTDKKKHCSHKNNNINDNRLVNQNKTSKIMCFLCFYIFILLHADILSDVNAFVCKDYAYEAELLCAVKVKQERSLDHFAVNVIE